MDCILAMVGLGNAWKSADGEQLIFQAIFAGPGNTYAQDLAVDLPTAISLQNLLSRWVAEAGGELPTRQ